MYNLDNVVKVWADYLQTRYHPRTVSIINEYEHNNEDKPFDVFNCGSNIWKTEQFQEDFIDRIRIYVEECDNMQVINKIICLARNSDYVVQSVSMLRGPVPIELSEV